MVAQTHKPEPVLRQLLAILWYKTVLWEFLRGCGATTMLQPQTYNTVVPTHCLRSGSQPSGYCSLRPSFFFQRRRLEISPQLSFKFGSSPCSTLS